MFERGNRRKRPVPGRRSESMRERGPMRRGLAGLLAICLPAVVVPESAGAATTATLSGTVLSAADRSPLAGARLYLGDPESGDVYPSEPTDTSGRFRVAGVPPSTYEVAVAVERGLYLVPDSVTLEGGAERTLLLAIDPQTTPGPDDAPATGLHLWSNPLTAALLVLGSALVVGVAVENATDDEDDASPTEP
jgi:hypothetical protein